MVDIEYTNIKEIYENEFQNIMKNKNIKSVLIVGSAKNIDLEDAEYINDIDLFVITQEGSGQVREMKLIQGIEFDINYFPISLVDELVRNNEYFFIQAMKNAKLVYDEYDLGKLYIQKCLQKYNQGPKEITKSEKSKLLYEVQSSLKRLEDNNIYNKFEYELLSNLYIKDIIRSYFMLNKKWVPKDKKLLSVLKKDNEELHELIVKFYQDHSYVQLEKIYNYVFKNIKVSDYIKINY
jgi:hypothetical protein